MAFVKTDDYFTRKILNIRQAIAGTETALVSLVHCDARKIQIDAHVSQIASQKQSLAKADAEYSLWKTHRAMHLEMHLMMKNESELEQVRGDLS
jgi:hypothetical protein